MKWLAIALAVAILAAVVWDAGERHYTSCIEHAKATATTEPYTAPFDELERLRGHDPATPATGKCSRLPWN